MDVAALRHSLLPAQVPGIRTAGTGRGLAVPAGPAALALEDSRERGLRVEAAPDGDAHDAGKKVESLFATLLVKELRKALPEEGFFGSGPGADVFNGWLDEFMGEQLARDGALGLADRVETALEEREGETR